VIIFSAYAEFHADINVLGHEKPSALQSPDDQQQSQRQAL